MRVRLSFFFYAFNFAPMQKSWRRDRGARASLPGGGMEAPSGREAQSFSSTGGCSEETFALVVEFFYLKSQLSFPPSPSPSPAPSPPLASHQSLCAPSALWSSWRSASPWRSPRPRLLKVRAL